MTGVTNLFRLICYPFLSAGAGVIDSKSGMGRLSYLMKPRTWLNEAILLVAFLLLSTAHLRAEGTGPCVINPVYLPDGRGQFEVQAPDTGPYALFYSFDMGKWEYWQMLTGASNYVIETPGPISSFGGKAFFRVDVGGAAINRLSSEFHNGWNGPLVSGTPVISWPQQIQEWYARLDVVNSLVFPHYTDVYFTGPIGSGINLHQAIYFEHDDDIYSGSYYGYFSSIAPTSGGNWAVDYGPQILVLNRPDPDAGNRFVMIVPTFVINGGMLESVSWTYRNPTTGAVLGTVPDFITGVEIKFWGPEYHLCGENDYTIFDSDSLDPSQTSIVFSPSLPWDNALMKIRYEDTLDNSYVLSYSFGNVYEVWGSTNFLGIDDCDPASLGYTYLGSDTATASFAGAYNFYLIRVPKHNVIRLDTVEAFGGTYYPPGTGGPPDGVCESVGGGVFGYHQGGTYIVNALPNGYTGITVHICP